MEQRKVQRLLDRLSISASALCLLHCLATPLLLVALPVLSATFMADETFHLWMVTIVLPLSLAALFIGCRRHRDGLVITLGLIGLLGLILAALLGHDVLGETGEKVATVVSGLLLAAGHWRNYRLCRLSDCDV